MSLMFQNATSFDQAINAWSISQVTNFNNFMTGVTLSTLNYDLLLPAWDAQGAMSYSGTVNFGSSQYHLGGAVEASRTSLISKWGGIIDGGGIAANNEFEFTWKTDNAGTSNDDQATLPFAISADLDCVVDWGDTDGSTTTLNSASSIGDLTHTYSGGSGTKSISISGTGINGFVFLDTGDKLKILDVSNVGNLDITESDSFHGCSNLTWTATDAPTITSTSLVETFRGCTNFNGNINNWDVSGVTSTSLMFYEATSFNQPLNNWNTGNVTNTAIMFGYATSFNQLLNNWDFSSVEDMGDMFFHTTSFNQPLNNWNVSSVTDMFRVFGHATSFDQDISSWDINQVSNLSNFMLVATLSTTNYDLLLLAWDAQGAMSFSGVVNFGNSTYTGGGLAETARTSLVTKWGGITDGGEA
jgi:surface protein